MIHDIRCSSMMEIDSRNTSKKNIVLVGYFLQDHNGEKFPWTPDVSHSWNEFQYVDHILPRL